LGILRHGQELFNPKWITAVITDSSSRLHIVPIKYALGDYFITELNRKPYVFKIDGSRIKIWRQTLARSFRILLYDTTHYKPITSEIKELELALAKNSLPKVNTMLLNLMKLLGRQEKAKFQPHKIADLLKDVDKYKDEYAEQVRNIETYLSNLKIDKIVTPLRNLADFLDSEVLTTDPGFLGTIVSHYQRTDIEHKKINNAPIGSKTAWLKWIAIFSLVGLVLAIIYMAYEQGAFDGLMKLGEPFGSVGEAWKSAMQGTGPKPQDVMSQFTPEQLKAAIDRGEVNPDSLPPDIRKLVEGVKLPTVSENP